MITLDDILTAAQIGETTDWEFKSGRGGFPRSFWETYSAMANSEGGVVVLGASETDDAVRLDGLTAEQVAAYQKVLWDGLNNRGVVSANVLEVTSVEVVPIESSRLLAVRIPRAARASRPVYLTGNPLGHTYRRRHEGDYRCDDAEVRRMFADAEPGGRDHRILKGFTLDDLDAPTLAGYRQRLSTARAEHVWLTLDDRDLLERLGGWGVDKTTGEAGLTLAAVLMFGTDLAIQNPDAVPSYFVDYRERLDPDVRWTDRICPDGTWEANLFQFYGRVWSRLSAAVPTPFRLEGGFRRDVTPAHEALREAFVNALIHGDYSAPGGLVIERLPHEITIENAGTLLVGLEQYRRGGVSECRNPGLQRMFRMIGGGEHAGSGAEKIRAGWRHQHWRAPLLKTFDHPDRVRLELPTVSLIPDQTLVSLKERFGPQVAALSSSELQALATAQIEGAVSNSRLQELVVDHPVDITRMLTHLCERGLLVSDNRRRWTTYELPRRGVEASLFDADDASQSSGDSLDKVTDSLGMAGSSLHNGNGMSGGLAGDLSHLSGDSLHLSGDSLHLSRDSLHLSRASEAEELHRLAEPVALTGKAPAAAMRTTILQLCAGRFLTAESLGTLLNRNPSGLQIRYLSPMVGEGLLQLKYPKATNRPDQAYTTSRDE